MGIPIVILIPKYLGFKTLKAAVDLIHETFKIENCGYNMFGLMYKINTTMEIAEEFCTATGSLLWE